MTNNPNLNPSWEQYLDIMVATATGGALGKKRWDDLRRNLHNRVKRGAFYVTPAEAEGIFYNSKRNKNIKSYTLPAELKMIASDALDEQPATASLPDKKEEPITNNDAETIVAFAELIKNGTITVDEAREIIGLPSLEEVEKEKPTSLDHSLWDLKVKKSEVALNDAAADLIKFCTDWANDLRNNK